MIIKKFEPEEPIVNDTTSSKRIFSFTEIIVNEIEIAKLPTLSNKSSGKISRKNSKSLGNSMVIEKPSVSWNDFVRSTYYAGNLTPKPKIMSTFLKQKLEQLNQSVEAEFTRSQSSKDVLRMAQNLEASPFVKQKLNEFENIVLVKKNIFNKIHHDVNLKERYLKELEKELEYLEQSNPDTSENENLLEYRTNEHKEMMQGLNNELYYQEILSFMISTRTADLKTKVAPINALKKEMNLLSGKIDEFKSHHQKLCEEIVEVEEEAKSVFLQMKEEKTEREQKINAELSTLKDSYRLEFCLSRERKWNKLQEKYKHDQKQLIVFERLLNNLQGDQSIKEEINRIEKKLQKQEEKFGTVQRATNIISVNDMHPYYLYLDEIKTKLNENAQNAQERIEMLNQERVSLSQQLNELLYQNEGFGASCTDVEMMDNKCKDLVIFINDYEKMIEKQEEVIVAFINSISRLTKQLGITKENNEINRDNLTDWIKLCENKLDSLIQIIKKESFLLNVESVNTSKSFVRSPTFLNLNNRRPESSDPNNSGKSDKKLKFFKRSSVKLLTRFKRDSQS